MRILINSYWCCPGKPSEPGVAWEYIARLIKRHQVTLITGTKFKDELTNISDANLKIVFINSSAHEKLRHIIKKPKLRVIVGGFYHYYWQFKAFVVCARLKFFERSKFEVFHHLSSFTWRWPALGVFLFKNSIWGPIGGGQNVPRALLTKLTSVAYDGYIRPFLARLNALEPLHYLILWHVKRVLIANSDTYRVLPKVFRPKYELMLETAFNANLVGEIAYRKESQNLLFVGTIMPGKGLVYLIEAMSAIVAEKPLTKLHVIGAGSDLEEMKKKARCMNLNSNVIFYGALPHSEVLLRYKDADIFVFPSLVDTSGNVTLEAMALGLPVIGFDTGGTKDIIDNYVNGIKIAVDDPDKAVKDLASAILMLAENAETRRYLGTNALKKVREVYNWDKKIDRLMEIYSEMQSANH